MKKISAIFGVFAISLAMLIFAGCASTSTGPASTGTAVQPQKSPDEIVKEGISKLSELKSAKFNMSMKSDIKDPKTGDNKLDLSLSGLADFKDMKAPKLVMKLDGSVSNKELAGASASAEVRIDTDLANFNVSKFEVKDQPLPKELTTLFNKWWFVKIPAKTMEEITKSAEKGGTEEISAEQEKMVKMLNEANIFSKPVLVGTEDVMGEPSWHYTVTLDKKSFTALALKASEEQGSALSEEEAKKFEEQMQKMDISGDIWVGSTSGIANQFKANVKLTGTAEEQSGTMSISMAIGDINKALSVEKPAGAEEFTEEKMMPLMMMFYGGGLPVQ